MSLTRVIRRRRKAVPLRCDWPQQTPCPNKGTIPIYGMVICYDHALQMAQR